MECPLAKLNAPKIARLAEDYRERGIAFVAIDPNAQDSLAELKAFATSQKFSFPVLMDKGGVAAAALSIDRVPTMLLLDDARRIVYRGRLDDQYGFRPGLEGRRLSYQLPKPRRRDLAEAIDELLAGKEISVAQTEATGCLVGHSKSPDESAKVTYSNQVARLFNDRCVYCHRAGQIGPFALGNYEDASGWAEMIAEVVSERRMPPWHADPAHGEFANDARLSEEEIQLVKDWVAAGAPEGNKSDLPEPPTFPEGWLMPTPDQVVYMKDKPYQVPAEGTVPYVNFVVDPGWKEDKWVTAMEPRPGNPKVVHHIVMYVSTAGGEVEIFHAGITDHDARLVRVIRAGIASAGPSRTHGSIYSRRLEAGLSDALHAVRHAGGGFELCGDQVCRPGEGEAGSRGAARGEYVLFDSRTCEESPVGSLVRF